MIGDQIVVYIILGILGVHCLFRLFVWLIGADWEGEYYDRDDPRWTGGDK